MSNVVASPVVRGLRGEPRVVKDVPTPYHVVTHLTPLILPRDAGGKEEPLPLGFLELNSQTTPKEK